MPLNKKILIFSKKYHLIEKRDRIIVGVSGGADSVALLLLLNELKLHLGLELIVAHYDHHLRKDSTLDKIFVEKLAQRLNLSFVTERWKDPQKDILGSVEEAAREKRLDFFVRYAKKEKATKIALAHTQNDLAETVLMRLLRGSGLQGLRGILPKKDLYGKIFIRPLLNVSRQDIEKYLKQHKQNFRTDPTNTEFKFFRNKIRHKLIPWINKEFKENCVSVLANAAETMSVDYDFSEEYAKVAFQKLNVSRRSNCVEFPLKLFTRQHLAIRRMILRRAITLLKGNTRQFNLKHINEIEDLVQFRPTLSRVDLPGSIVAKKTSNMLSLTRTNS